MIPILASIVVPLLMLIFLPKLAQKKGKDEHKYRTLLYAACFIYFIAWYLPSPIIDGLDTGFWTHFSGGITVGFIWLYLVKTGIWKMKNLSTQILVLYGLVSALGVLNELAEFVLVKMNLFNISLADTSWDLVANTLGAASFFIVYKIIDLVRR